MSRVSICVPTYNRKHYLRETLDSVFKQSFRDFEVVIVDDGSTDGTGRMLREIGFDVRYCWQENAGDAAARNRLIELARGEFITFLDSDDLLFGDSVERLVSVMERERGNVVAYGAYDRIDEHGRTVGTCRRRPRSGRVTAELFQDIFVHSCGSMFPRRALKQSGGFDTSLPVCSDYDLWLRLSLTHRFVALERPTFKRRRHSQNLSGESAANRMAQLKVLERFYYEGGGRAVVPPKAARRRLSREAYKAGLLALRAGDTEQGRQLLRKSFQRRPNVRALLYLTLASGRSRRAA